MPLSRRRRGWTRQRRGRMSGDHGRRHRWMNEGHGLAYMEGDILTLLGWGWFCLHGLLGWFEWAGKTRYPVFVKRYIPINYESISKKLWETWKWSGYDRNRFHPDFELDFQYSAFVWKFKLERINCRKRDSSRLFSSLFVSVIYISWSQYSMILFVVMEPSYIVWTSSPVCGSHMMWNRLEDICAIRQM
jgi:hypothetical protein